jgi:xylan 1,4-beta-xylosidase
LTKNTLQVKGLKMKRAAGLKVIAALLLGIVQWLPAQDTTAKTYANPMDLNYRFSLDAPSRREAADPTMVVFQGEYWLFASKSGGYWRSRDLAHWTLVKPTGLPLEDYAPTVMAMSGRLYFTAFNSKGIWSTDDPGKGAWTKDADIDAYADPDLFLDDDGRVYLYSGCSNKTPLTVTELDPKHQFKAIRTESIAATRDPEHRGFEVPGENNESTGTAPWIEGAWMTKHGGKYYLQYAAPGTQFSSYADGVLVGDSPWGPFQAPAYSPLSLKPAGFINGAGHGSTFQDLQGRWWHIASMTISVRHMFERRLGLFPVRFLPDGQMVEDTYLADYPHRWDGDRGLARWMLLSYEKPVTASSALEGHPPEKAVDENVRDWWSAKSGDASEWLQVDLGATEIVHTVQIDFADEGSTTLGFGQGPYLYRIEGSTDGTKWSILVDRSSAGRDAPQDYEELTPPAHVRYVRIRNFASPNGARFSLSGLRVFGEGTGTKPEKVAGVAVARSAQEPDDARVAEVSWRPAAGAEFYIVRYGIAPDKLFASEQVYHATEMEMRSLISGVRYFLAVDAVNASGITPGKETVVLQP